MRDKGDTQTTPFGTETVSAEGSWKGLPVLDNPLAPRSTNVLHQVASMVYVAVAPGSHAKFIGCARSFASRCIATSMIQQPRSRQAMTRLGFVLLSS